MSVRKIIALIIFWLLCSTIMSLNPCFAEGLRFPPESEDEFLGHFTYEIPFNAWISKLRQLLPNKNYALEFRTNRKYEVVFLLRVEKSLEDCKNEHEFCSDRIVAVLKVPKRTSDEGIFFDCQLKKKKHQSNEVVFGLVKSREVPGYYSPRLAWLVKFDTLTFEPVDRKSVKCALFGLDEEE
ncbi:MAG: hypothetical protein ABSD50_17720 [Smithella sp.]